MDGKRPVVDDHRARRRDGGQEGSKVDEPAPQVVRAAAAGDLDAFTELVRTYQMPVWRFLRHLLGDAELAEDVTQDTFLRVHRNLAGFEFRSKFSTWIFRIARNAGTDALRAQQRRARLIRAVQPAPPAGDAATGVELSASLASLAPKLREAFILVEVFGLPYREAGDALGVPEGTVKSRVFHARGQLVAWLRAGEPGERVGEV